MNHQTFIHQQTGLPKHEIADVLKAFRVYIHQELRADRPVRWPGIGTFRTVMRRGRSFVIRSSYQFGKYHRCDADRQIIRPDTLYPFLHIGKLFRDAVAHQPKPNLNP
jgi:hypothetical protein